MSDKNYRAGFLGLIGQPNAGKSSLMNFLISEKVSIVTPKPQTTRRRILGLATEPQGQVVFVDAPGIVKATSGLNHFLQKEAEDVIKSSDALCAVLSIGEEYAENNTQIVEMVSKSRKPWFAIINKVDLSDKIHRISLIKSSLSEYNVPCITVSTLENRSEEIAEIKKTILDTCISLLPQAPAPLYDAELFTTESVRFLAEEIIREKCFECLEYEIPYQLALLVRRFDEDAKPCPKIYADIIVAKESHKPVVIGKGGAVIKKIGEQSRSEIEKLMSVNKIYLELNVVVKNDWFENKNSMKDLKYVIDNK
jgi:GTPase